MRDPLAQILVERAFRSTSYSAAVDLWRQRDRCAAIYDDVSQARGSCRLGSNQWCDFERNRTCVDRSECVWCYDRLGAHPGGLKVVNLTASHLARKMARRDKRHRRSGRPVVQHDIQKTRFVKYMQRRRPACEATEGGTPAGGLGGIS